MCLFSKNSLKLCLLLVAVSTLAIATSGQAKKKPIKKNAAKSPVMAPTIKPVQVQTLKIVPTDEPLKKNDRGTTPLKINDISRTATVPAGTRYSYTFDRPGFPYSHIVIEHDDSGKGKITMKKDGSDEAFADPIEVTGPTMNNLKRAFTALDFLNSKESYQYAARDYSHMGNIVITLTKDGHSRTAKFNWTDNKDAKALMDEYRRISNEYTWRFEMASARENQTLLTPGLVDTFANYLDRNELPDPPHLVPLLTELSLDERLPLIARNRAKRIILQIIKTR